MVHPNNHPTLREVVDGLDDLEQRMKSALSLVTEAKDLLAPSVMLPVPTSHFAMDMADLDAEIRALESFAPEMTGSSAKPKKAKRTAKGRKGWSPQKRAAFSRKMKRVMTEKWASLTGAEHDAWVNALKRGRGL